MANLKITEYPNSVVTLQDADLFDVSVIAAGPESQKMTWAVMKTNLPTLYNEDGTLQSARTVDIDSLELKYINGAVKVHEDETAGVPILSADTVFTVLDTATANSSANASIISGSNASASLNFGDESSEGQGQIEYDNSVGEFNFYTSATQAMNIDSSQRTGLGINASTTSRLRISADSSFTEGINLTMSNVSAGNVQGLQVVGTAIAGNNVIRGALFDINGVTGKDAVGALATTDSVNSGENFGFVGQCRNAEVNNFGIVGDIPGSFSQKPSGENIAVFADATPSKGEDNYGVKSVLTLGSDADLNNSSNYGVYSQANSNSNTGSTSYGGYFEAINGDNNYAIVTNGGNIGFGTITPDSSAILELSSTTGALLLPRMTTAERDALTPSNGMIIYNTTTNAFNFRENGAWVTGSGLA